MKNAVRCAVLIAVVITGTFSCVHNAREQEHSTGKPEMERIAQSYEYYREIATGFGSTAMRAPFGRYLLLRSGDELLAVKITKRIVKSWGAEYEWIWFKGSERESGTGTFSENEEKTQLAVHAFRVTWSASDWFYYNMPDLEMSRSEIVDGSKIMAAVDNLFWYTQKRLKDKHEREIGALRETLGLEQQDSQ